MTLAIEIIAVAAALVIAHALFWRWYLRAPWSPTAIVHVVEPDGARLSLGFHEPAGTRRFAEPVVFCHGLGANRYNLDFEGKSLARAVAAEGFASYVAEMRGIGLSRAPAGAVTFDDYARRDAPAILAEVTRRSRAPRAFWVGHSMGGMVGYVVGQEASANMLAGLVAIGSPATWTRQGYLRPIARLGTLLALAPWLDRKVLYWSIAPLCGWWYPRAARLMANPENMEGPVVRRLVAHLTAPIRPGVIRQFADWIAESRFGSADGTTDWRAGLPRFTAPALLVAGTQDMMAPPEAIAEVHASIGSADKTLAVFGRDHGHAVDYGHGDLVVGRHAPDEVFPAILAWLRAHATPSEPRA